MKVPLYKPYITGEEVPLVKEVIERESYWVNGPEIKKFEEEVCKVVGSKFAIAFNSGTSALHAMMLAHNIQAGDEIIVPGFTYIATANSALFVGAKPVFADIETETYALDPDDVRKKITPKTKAIMPIHYGGIAAKNINELRELAQERGIILLEDAAESLGATLNGKQVGSFGSSSMFSLCGNKVVTSGEGGVVVTSDPEVNEKLKLIRNHGRKEWGDYFAGSDDYDYIEVGFNFRMPSIVAAMAYAQVKNLSKIVSLRRKVAKIYDEAFSEYVKTPPDGGEYFTVYQMYSILLKNRNSRDELKKYLLEKEISNKVYFTPAYEYTIYKKLGYTPNLKVTKEISERILSLPIYPSMTEEEIRYTMDSVIKKIRG